MYYALLYTTCSDYLERRGAYRQEHLARAAEAHERGELLLAGAFAEPADAALFVFKGDSPAAAEAFARADPYVLHGLVTAWRVRPWSVVVGG